MGRPVHMEDEGMMPVDTKETISREEERSLAVRAKAGDRDAIGELLEAHKGAAYKIARGAARRVGLADDVVEDLAAEARECLLDKIKTYEPDRDSKLLTYAWKEMHGRVLEEIGTYLSAVKLNKKDLEDRKDEQELWSEWRNQNPFAHGRLRQIVSINSNPVACRLEGPSSEDQAKVTFFKCVLGILEDAQQGDVAAGAWFRSQEFENGFAQYVDRRVDITRIREWLEEQIEEPWSKKQIEEPTRIATLLTKRRDAKYGTRTEKIAARRWFFYPADRLGVALAKKTPGTFRWICKRLGDEYDPDSLLMELAEEIDEVENGPARQVEKGTRNYKGIGKDRWLNIQMMLARIYRDAIVHVFDEQGDDQESANALSTEEERDLISRAKTGDLDALKRYSEAPPTFPMIDRPLPDLPKGGVFRFPRDGDPSRRPDPDDGLLGRAVAGGRVITREEFVRRCLGLDPDLPMDRAFWTDLLIACRIDDPVAPGKPLEDRRNEIGKLLRRVTATTAAA